MHESSIMLALLEQVEQIANQNNLSKVDDIYISVGHLHQVVPQVLQNVFDHLRLEFSCCTAAKLHATYTDVVLHCNSCQQNSTLEDQAIFLCPKCGSLNTSIGSGNQLLIEKITGEQ